MAFFDKSVVKQPAEHTVNYRNRQRSDPGALERATEGLYAAPGVE